MPHSFPSHFRVRLIHIIAVLLCFVLASATLIVLKQNRGIAQSDKPEINDDENFATRTPKEARFVPGEVVVRFREDAPAARAQRGYRLRLRKPVNVTDEATGGDEEITANVERTGGEKVVRGLRLARVSPRDTLKAVARLNRRADVLYAQPNYIYRRTRTPNDPSYSTMWSLKNTGQNGGTVEADIKAELAWDITRGSRDIVVGVVDEGIDASHQDLQANIWRNRLEAQGTPGVDDDGNGFIDDLNGWNFDGKNNVIFNGTEAHGTHVAGTIGAHGDNARGVTGVNWEVSVMSIKVLGTSGGTTSDIVAGIGYAKQMRDLWVATGGAKGANIRVLNNSYGGDAYDQANFDAIRAAGDSGILFVVAAGNDGKDNDVYPSYPAAYRLPNILSVAATNRTDGLSVFSRNGSNFGSRSVDLGAPGSSIISTTPNNTYSIFNGTSMATPHVAGAAALVWSLNPALTVRQVRGAILYSGDRIAGLDGKTVTGRRLNVFNAMQSIIENDTVAPAPINLRAVALSGRTLAFTWTAPGDDGISGQAADYDFVFHGSSDGKSFVLPHSIVPAATGSEQRATFNMPYRYTSGTFELITYDNAGNAGSASFNFTLPLEARNDPYISSFAAHQTLSSGGTGLNLRGDDRYLKDYALPFAFPFYNRSYSSLTVSTNGALYFSAPPLRTPPASAPEEIADDAGSSLDGLNAQIMIAGLWDDLRTDREGGDVFVLQPDGDTIIFRWQSVTYDTPLGDGTKRGENPVNFEIELKRNGTVRVRYGAGNTNLLSVVGISGGEPDAYAVREYTASSGLVALPSEAQTAVFSLRPAVSGASPKRRSFRARAR
ncbi:MAG: S8 family serine peptidase [Pyrinomonadaceae bacterium MAG19_C2-C3]|nr:S8 family serine peptidase [Pyrinomonadaceae bacterium MAG19_C2-C3]